MRGPHPRRHPTEPEPAVLSLVGCVASESLALVHAGLPLVTPASTAYYFASYSPVDFPVGAMFEVAFVVADPLRAAAVQARLEAVTQQFGKPFDAVPTGWKTICAIRFSQEPPAIVRELPILRSWSSEALVGLTSSETWRVLCSSITQPDRGA